MICKFKDLRIFQIITDAEIIMSYENFVDEVDILVSWSNVMPRVFFHVRPPPSR